MLRKVYSERSQRDLEGISDYIARDDPAAAFRWLEQADALMDLLTTAPGAGEAVSHLSPGVRRVSQGDYVFYFRPAADHVELVRVTHGARRLDDLDL